MSSRKHDRHPSDDLRSSSSRVSDTRRQHDVEQRTAQAADATSRLSDRAPQSPTTRLTPQSSSSQFRRPQPPPSPSVGESHAKQAKVAIPRLKRDFDSDGTGTGRAGGRHRVNHACEPCRHRKTKCSGERPVCRHCQDFKIDCYYADGKRDRVKKQFGTMTEKVAEYERLLKELEKRVSDEEARLIRATLDKAAQTEVPEHSVETATLPSIENGLDDDGDPAGAVSGAESEVSADRGSTGALDRTDEDFTREGAKDTGFIGKNSEITWMQRLAGLNEHGAEERPTPPTGQSKDPNVHQTSYHLDDLPVTILDAIDMYELPTPDAAEALFSTYMKRVHPTFPVVGQINLTSQFQKFISNPGRRPPAKWLAIINIMFAISARYSHLIQADWQGDDRDHLIYFTRARMLAINEHSICDHPDLQHIQIWGLMGFYFFCTGQINRSWLLIGMAIRAATGLGLNIRNNSPSLGNGLKEIRYRLWWALFGMEHRLCTLTGRVSSVLNNQCTTPLPIPIDEHLFEGTEAKVFLSQEKQAGERAPLANPISPSASSSDKRSRSLKSDQSRSPSALNSMTELEWAKDAQPGPSLYFLHFVQLTRITQNIFHELYRPTTVSESWSSVQERIKELNGQVETWYRSLPPALDFRRKQRDRDYYEFRLNLGFNYYGTKQMINRPCLCLLDEKIPNQSPQSQDFNRNSAVSCVEAAQDTLALIPDEPNSVGLMTVGPWWSLLHWIVQATTVLMLEISFRAHHMPQEADSILDSAKKGVRWLHAMGQDNVSAARAWTQCNQLLVVSASKVGRSVNDLPASPPNVGDTALFGTGFPTVGQPDQQDLYGSSTNFDTSMMAPSYHGFPNYDPSMHYSPYVPSTQNVNMSISGPSPSMMPFLNESEMEYIMSQNYQTQDEGVAGGSGMDSQHNYPS